MAASKMAGAGGCDLQQGRSFRGAVLPIKSGPRRSAPPRRAQRRIYLASLVFGWKYKYSTTNFAVVPGNLTTTRNVHLPGRYIRQILTTTNIIIYFIRQNRPYSIHENQPSKEPHGERPRALRLGAPLRHLLVASESRHGHLQ